MYICFLEVENIFSNIIMYHHDFTDGVLDKLVHGKFETRTDKIIKHVYTKC